MNTAAIDNALHHQKDELMSAYKRGENGIRDALVILGSCAELWCALGYAYKGREILTEIRKLLIAEQDVLHHRSINRRIQIAAQLQLANDLTTIFNNPDLVAVLQTPTVV